MTRSMGWGWLIYGALCVAVPILWGLGVCGILRSRHRRRHAIPAPHRRDSVPPGTWDYSI